MGFTVKVNNEQGYRFGPLTSNQYAWSPIYTESQLFYYDFNNNVIFPNQDNYTITVQFGVQDATFPAYVKNVNLIMQVIDGLPSG